ncbi:MAG TPA: serine protease [Pyrinomonadaceae bacterium]|nr:serine protease [Pyrinomonadaceae bacterium]
MYITPTSAGMPRPVTPRNGLLTLRRELLDRISLTGIVLGIFAVALFAGTIVFVVRSVLTSYEGEQKLLGVTETQSRRIDEQDKQIANLNQRITQMDQQMALLKNTGTALNEVEPSSVHAVALAPAVWGKYGDGVCLIAGSFELVEPRTGRPLRYPETEQNAAESLLVIGIQQQLTFEGNGRVFEREFEATGFHVGGGYVLTNRHIATEPWAADRRTQYLMEMTGAKPRVKHLLAYFPKHRQPIPLKFKSSSKTDDIAVCTLQSKTIPSGIPSLPLGKEPGAVEIGKPVVTIGYPTGPDRLLALLPEKDAVGLMDQYGASLTTLLDQLATRKLIRPMLTQGHIRDLYENRIVVDAMTTKGSSGTPMFGETGKVIGVTFAVLADDASSNFVVGIEGAIEQLRRAGWKPV